MGHVRLVYLLLGLTIAQVLLTALYALQTLLGRGMASLLGVMALLSLSLVALSLSVWRRVKLHRHIYRERRDE